MKKTILSLTGFFLAVLSFAGTEPVPKPFLELKLNGNLENTGTGKFTVSKLRPDNLGWKKGRNNDKSFYFNNDLRNRVPAAAAVRSSYRTDRRNAILRSPSPLPCGSCRILPWNQGRASFSPDFPAISGAGSKSC